MNFSKGKIIQPLFKIGLATPCSSFVQIVLCMVYLIYMERKRKGRE